MQEIHGWKVPDADTYVSRKLGARVADYQRHDLARATSFVAQRRLALDSGGHIGTSANQLSRLFRRVVTFEPAADTFACLIENMSSMALSNVEAHNLALADKPGTAALVPYSRDPGNVGARSLVVGNDVVVACLDDFDFTDLDFVKIDVEGFESLVLWGGAFNSLPRAPSHHV
jgi:FkbM family methyltransferase